jgi:hypothetical protein
VVLTAHDDRLIFDAPAGVMTPALRVDVVRRKAELLALLAGDFSAAASALLLRHVETLADDEWRALEERFVERAAVAEFDGNLSRGEAERVGYQEIEAALTSESQEIREQWR